jgi:sortase A
MSPKRPGASAHCQSSLTADFWQSAHFLFQRCEGTLRIPGGRLPIASLARFQPKSASIYLRFLPALFILIGLLLCSYVAANYAWMQVEQNRLAHEWQSQPTSSPTDRSNGSSSLARLVIPKINLNAVVVEGTSRRALLVGPGHLVHTAGLGEPGNSVVAGHRDTFFRHLGELVSGDSIYVDRGGKLYQYHVTDTRVVEPSDTSVLKTSAGNHLTLITCYPIRYIGPAPKRLVVIAESATAGEAAQAFSAVH